MAEVMIGIDPHKGSHTAVAIGVGEEPLGELRVRACPSQAEQLLAWAVAWPERTWAVEGAAGLGRLLAQQLVAAGERVLDVPPKLAARVRLLQAGARTERPQRRPVGGGRGAALPIQARGARRGSCRRAEGVGQAAPGPGPGPQPGRLPAARRAVRPGPWRSPEGDLRSPGRPHPGAVSPPPARLPGPAASSPPSSSPTSAAWMPSCATPTRSWPPRSKPPAPPSPRSSVSAQSSRAP